MTFERRPMEGEQTDIDIWVEAFKQKKEQAQKQQAL
jgi:hypothetical protein